MKYYTAVVKGDKDLAITRAAHYGIVVQEVLSENHREGSVDTVLRLDGEERTFFALQQWIGDTGDCIVGRGFPDGDLLLFTEHEAQKPKHWTSTVDYTFGVSYWIDDRDTTNASRWFNHPSEINRYDACVSFIKTGENMGYWTVTETQWRRIE